MLPFITLKLQTKEFSKERNPDHVLYVVKELPVPFRALSACAFGNANPQSLIEGCTFPLGFLTPETFEKDGQIAAHLIGHDYGLGDVRVNGTSPS